MWRRGCEQDFGYSKKLWEALLLLSLWLRGGTFSTQFSTHCFDFSYFLPTSNLRFFLFIPSQDKYHLFIWTDERVVEEVEDLKVSVSEMKQEILVLRSDIAGLGNQLEQSKLMLEFPSNGNGCCLIL